MKAVVLAAGLGTRLGDLTASRSKATLLVGGRPLVAHVVAHLARRGFGDIAVNLWHEPNQVRAALAGADARITWFEETELLGTAGALTPMHEFLAGDDAFLVHYADVLTDHDLAGMLRQHRDRNALLTMLVHERPGSNSLVEIDDDDRIRAFLERPGDDARAGHDSPWVNSGVYAMTQEILTLVPPPPSDLAADLVSAALAAGPVFAERLRGFRCAVDSPQRLEEAEAALSSGDWKAP